MFAGACTERGRADFYFVAAASVFFAGAGEGVALDEESGVLDFDFDFDSELEVASCPFEDVAASAVGFVDDPDERLSVL